MIRVRGLCVCVWGGGEGDVNSKILIGFDVMTTLIYF